MIFREANQPKAACIQLVCRLSSFRNIFLSRFERPVWISENRLVSDRGAGPHDSDALSRYLSMKVQVRIAVSRDARSHAHEAMRRPHPSPRCGYTMRGAKRTRF